MIGALARIAAGAAVPVFPAVGVGARQAVQDLTLRHELQLLDAPRQANVLLLAGHLPQALAQAADAAHDVMSHPRCTVRWAPGARDVSADGIVEVMIDAHRALLSGERASERPVLPDEDPAPWRGVGPYGQGGSGMTGGVPYGRPMAERADDRDGLALDQLRVRVGPLFCALPTGLTLDLAFHGDVLHEVEVGPNPFNASTRPELAPALRPFVRALDVPVPIAELELARARHHLRWLAEALRIQGLAALSRRVLRLAHRVKPADAGSVGALAGRLRRSRVLGWATKGIGIVEDEVLASIGTGPVARAAGMGNDVRSGDPAYQSLGFEPIVGEGGDASARWRQRIAEAAQALELAGRAGEARAGGIGLVEAPGGRLEAGWSASGEILRSLPEIISGMEWGGAVATIVSLDLDLEEVAAVAQAGMARV